MRVTTRASKIALFAVATVVVAGLSPLAVTASAAGSATAWTRVAGADRYETAAAVSRAGFPTGASSAVVASGEMFPDGLSASYVAGLVGGPVLLTPASSLPAATLAEVTRLHVSTVYVAGGTAAVSTSVEGKLAALRAPNGAAVTVRRLAGADRYATADAIAAGFPKGSVGMVDGERVALLASGTGFADALSGSAAAAGAHLPLLLTSPDRLSTQVLPRLQALGVSRVVVLGGTGAISASVAKQLTDAGLGVNRLGGADRVETAALIASWEIRSLGFAGDQVAVARGDEGGEGVDALSVGAFIGGGKHPLLLTASPNALGGALLSWLQGDTALTGGVVAGGPAAISEALMQQLLGMTDGPTGLPGPVTSPPAVLGPVTNVTASPTSTSVVLAWTNPTDVNFNGVRICRAQGAIAPSGSTCSALATIAKPGATLTDPGLTASTQYSYAVFAIDKAGNAATGANATAMTLASATASVSGTVTDNASPAQPLTGVDVEVAPSGGSGAAAYATTATDGTYSVSGLSAGSYTVCFYPPTGAANGYLAQCYDDKVADGSVTPNSVTVTAGATAGPIDAALTAAGAISGTVTVAGGSTGVGNVDVAVAPAGGSGAAAYATTATDGTYSVSGLSAGNYTVCFYSTTGAADGYVSQCHNDKPVDGSVTPDSVAVTAGATTGHIDAALTATGAISGTVTAAGGSAGVGNVDVAVQPSGGSGATVYATTAADGRYAVSGLGAGSYTVCFYPPVGSTDGYVPQCYNNEPSDGSVAVQPVTVAGGSATAHIDAALSSAGSASGTVTSAANSSPIAGVDVELEPSGGSGATVYATTAADGKYAVSGLSAGSYKVCFYPPTGVAGGFVAQCYSDKPADGSVALDSVTVTAGATAGNIDAALTAAGAISGTVTAAAGSIGMGNVEVAVFPVGNIGTQIEVATAGDGSYVAAGLPPGDYTVCFYPPVGELDRYIAQCYNDKPADGSVALDSVTVTAGATDGNIDAALTAPGAISGTVTAAAGSAGVGSVDVALFPAGNGGTRIDVVTAADGSYTAAGLSAGDYTVCFYPPTEAAGGYVAQCYNNLAADGSVTLDSVAVTAGATAGNIDAALTAAGAISGTVTAAAGSAGVGSVDVALFPAANGGTRIDVVTAADGSYTASGLSAGDYTVCFYPPTNAAGGYVAQCYNDKPADGSLALDSVTVTAGATAGNINAALTP